MQTSETIHPEKIGSGPTRTDTYTVGRIQRWEVDGNKMLIYGENANVAVSFLTGEIIRIRLFFGEKVDWSSTTAVVMEDRPVPITQITETENELILQSDALRAVVDKASFTFNVFTVDGRPVCEEQGMWWDSKGAVAIRKRMDAQSHFYGLGEKTGFLDKRGERYTMWNSDVYAPHVPEIEALYQSIPFLIHYRMGGVPYGIFLDNPGKTVFDMRTANDSYTFQTETGDLDYYLIYGSTLKEVVSRYSDLTGKMPLPPKWALGYHQSRYSYMNQEEVLDLARTFRKKRIPCDVIYLDIHYMDEYRVFTWDKTRFPNPKVMMNELRDMGFRIVPIVDPGVKKDPKYPIYREGIEQDHFCRKLEGDLFIGPVWPGESTFPDFTDDRTAKWWGEKHKGFVDSGIEGIWNDMNEPAVFNDSKTMDLDVVHRNNGNSKTHEELHNLYGLLMSKATHEGLKEQLQGKRPFVLTRAGYAGVQRYAAVWTGDNRSFWEHMALAIPMVLNLGLSGVAFAGPDIGGFAHHTSGELLARWTQMGVFFPYSRNHSAIDTLRQEPWSFGEEVESIARKYIQMRYKWMPYLYSLFREASTTGIPVMRPLLLEYPEDPKVLHLSDQFLVGRDILIAPILRPDTEYRAVYLPEGVWYDYWTGERHPGGQAILAQAPLDTLPIFIKAGAILPEESVRQHAEEATDGWLDVRVYGGNMEGSSQDGIGALQVVANRIDLYEDDGQTYAYENGEYNLLRCEWEEKQDEALFSYQYAHRGYKNGWKGFRFRLLHLLVPQEIEGLERVNPDQLADLDEGWTYDEATRETVVKISSKSPKQYIRIVFAR